MTARISAAALQRMWQSGVPTAEIAAHFGCHVDTVRRCAARLGLERRRHGGSKPRNWTAAGARGPGMRFRISFSEDLHEASGRGWRVDVLHPPGRPDGRVHELWSFPTRDEAEAEVSRAKGQIT